MDIMIRCLPANDPWSTVWLVSSMRHMVTILATHDRQYAVIDGRDIVGKFDTYQGAVNVATATCIFHDNNED